MKNHGKGGTFTRPAAIPTVRTLPVRLERIWQYLTESERKRARRLAGGAPEQKVGSRVECVMVHPNLAQKRGTAHASPVVLVGPPKLLAPYESLRTVELSH